MRRLPLLCSLGFALVGCNTRPPSGGDPEPAVDLQQQTIHVQQHRKVDILMVVDDSGSMADSADALAEAMRSMGERLQQPEARLNLRVALTTTSNLHPRCGEGTSGAFVDSPCRGRSGAFVSNGDESEPGNWFDEGCASFCTASTAAALMSGLEPTSTDVDPTPAPRPWLEYNALTSNLPTGIDLGEALACIGPQGVSGCQFEEPLEATYTATERMLDELAPEFGFMRDDASLFVLVLTDEDDCSRSDTQRFDDLNADSVTCWNAAADCEPLDDGFACETAETPDLLPLERYLDRLAEIDAHKREGDPDAQVLMAIVGGFSPVAGEPQFFAEPTEAEDEAFGRAAGCTDNGIRAYPAVRLPYVAEQFNQDPTSSLCTQADDGLGNVLGFGEQLRPSCFEGCPLDVEPEVEGLQTSCTVEETVAGVSQELPACVLEAGQHQPPSGETSCFVTLTDPEPGSPTSLSAECVDDGHQLEFQIIRTVPVVDTVSVVATCAVSPDPETDC